MGGDHDCPSHGVTAPHSRRRARDPRHSDSAGTPPSRLDAAELAARVGVSPRTILAVEKGSPGSAIGTVFNAAVMAGVPLFGVEDRVELARLRRRGEERLALIPSRVDHAKDDDSTDAFDF